MCPYCKVTRPNAVDAKNDCDANTVLKPCLIMDPVCVLGFTRPPANPSDHYRDCGTRKIYNGVKDFCATKAGNCLAAMCDTTGCKAEIRTP